MNRANLVHRLSIEHPNLTVEDIDQAVQLILDAIATTLAMKERVEIRGFGSFEVRERHAFSGINPRTGIPFSSPARVAPHFRPGKLLRWRVSRSSQSMRTTTPTTAVSKYATP